MARETATRNRRPSAAASAKPARQARGARAEVAKPARQARGAKAVPERQSRRAAAAKPARQARGAKAEVAKPARAARGAKKQVSMPTCNVFAMTTVQLKGVLVELNERNLVLQHKAHERGSKMVVSTFSLKDVLSMRGGQGETVTATVRRMTSIESVTGTMDEMESVGVDLLRFTTESGEEVYVNQNFSDSANVDIQIFSEDAAPVKGGKAKPAVEDEDSDEEEEEEDDEDSDEEEEEDDEDSDDEEEEDEDDEEEEDEDSEEYSDDEEEEDEEEEEEDDDFDEEDED